MKTKVASFSILDLGSRLEASSSILMVYEEYSKYGYQGNDKTKAK